jgi:hypothetical protein
VAAVVGVTVAGIAVVEDAVVANELATDVDAASRDPVTFAPLPPHVPRRSPTAANPAI